MPNVYILCGPPGIGKSTLIKTHKLKPYVSRDDIRLSIVRDSSKSKLFSQEDLVRSTYFHTLAWYLANGNNVFADSTNLTPSARHRMVEDVLKAYNMIRRRKKKKTIKFITIDCVPKNIRSNNSLIKLCRERNSQRTGVYHTPDGELVGMCKSYIRPDIKDEPWIYINVPVENIANIWNLKK